MDIYHILSQLPHNAHFLKRYVRFITYYKNNPSTTEKTQKHHICPKAIDMFPQYAQLRLNPWNSVSLTRRQHAIAHIILSYAFPSIKQNSYSCVQLINFSSVTRPIFKSIKERHKQWLKDDIKGRNMSVKGTTYITNGFENKRVFLSEFQIPEGWREGKTTKKPKTKKLSYHDPNTQKEFKFVDIDSVPKHLVPGRQQKFRDAVRKTSLGNKANSNKILVTNTIIDKPMYISLENFDNSYMIFGFSSSARQRHKKRATVNNSGDKNPCFGTKRMHNPETGENRAVKLDLVDQFLKNGFVFGNKKLK